jgi:hypothetical protein
VAKEIAAMPKAYDLPKNVIDLFSEVDRRCRKQELQKSIAAISNAIETHSETLDTLQKSMRSLRCVFVPGTTSCYRAIDLCYALKKASNTIDEASRLKFAIEKKAHDSRLLDANEASSLVCSQFVDIAANALDVAKKKLTTLTMSVFAEGF